MTSLKSHFLKNLLMDFTEILTEDVKLKLGEVLKVLYLYLPSFLSHQKIWWGANWSELNKKSGGSFFS